MLSSLPSGVVPTALFLIAGLLPSAYSQSPYSIETDGMLNFVPIRLFPFLLASSFSIYSRVGGR